jgi:hypothetical protein
MWDELLTLPQHLISSAVSCGVRIVLFLLTIVLSVLFLLTIVLSVLFLLTIVLSVLFIYLWLVITPFISSNHSSNLNSLEMVIPDKH